MYVIYEETNNADYFGKLYKSFKINTSLNIPSKWLHHSISLKSLLVSITVKLQKYLNKLLFTIKYVYIHIPNPN